MRHFLTLVLPQRVVLRYHDTSLDEVTPPSAPRFSPSDGAALERLMLRLADAPREASAEELIAWAARFNREAYRQRLAALIEELS